LAISVLAPPIWTAAVEPDARLPTLGVRPNQALRLTEAALLVVRDIKFLRRPRQVSLGV
jgi:hypothetical protein